MAQRIEDLITAYKYWSSRYAASSHVGDFQKKKNIVKQLTEEANQQGISNEELEKRLSR
jgi:hypothetical protein